MWKQKKIAELRERQIKMKQMEEDLAWKKEEEERRKKEDADLAFNAWKRNKLKDERESTTKAMYVRTMYVRSLIGPQLGTASSKQTLYTW